MNLKEAINIILDEAITVERIKNYLSNAKEMIDKGNIEGALVTLSGMSRSIQKITGSFEAADQGQIKKLTGQIKTFLTQNKSKISNKEKYDQSIQSLESIENTLQDAQANVVKDQQVTSKKLAPKTTSSNSIL